MPSPIPYNDLDLGHWREYGEVETDSLWMIAQRDRHHGHRLEYHGNFVPQVARQLITRYSRRGEIVADLFLGSGTTALEARHLRRRCLGVELQPALVAHVRAKFDPADHAHLRLLAGDSAAPATAARLADELAAWGDRWAQLVLLHPPYHDIIRFSADPRDLSNAGDTDAFLAGFDRVIATADGILQPGRFLGLVIGDKYAQGEVVPLGFLCMELLRRRGYRLKGVVVKNMTGNEKGKGRTANLWRYRALRGGFYIFKHEYVFVAQKAA